MASLRTVFDRPRLLADDSSVCRTLARTASLISSLAIHDAVARVDCDVGSSRAGNPALARSTTLPSRLAVGSVSVAVCLRAVCVFAIREKFQREATWRPAGNSWWKSRSATGNGWNPGACAASRIPGASVRDAGMECRNRTGRLLGVDGVRSGHGSRDDPTGGCGVGGEVWRLLPRLSQIRAGRSAASMGSAPAIIRSNCKLMAHTRHPLLMRSEPFVATRYLRAKRRQAFIGVITGISVLGVAAGVAS